VILFRKQLCGFPPRTILRDFLVLICSEFASLSSFSCLVGSFHSSLDPRALGLSHACVYTQTSYKLQVFSLTFCLVESVFYVFIIVLYFLFSYRNPLRFRWLEQRSDKGSWTVRSSEASMGSRCSDVKRKKWT